MLIANLVQQLKSDKNMVLDENLVRHMVLNSLRSYIKQFKSKYGEIVVCCDNKYSWRRDVFPFYKVHRKKDREESPLDWGLIFESLNKIRAELKEFFNYKVLEVDKAEADDLIAVLVKYAYARNPNEPVLILSSDKDFMQLQKFPNVTQYSPIMKKYISTDNPGLFLKEHIIKGDKGDGIPNFLSSDNTFVVGDRQKVINSGKLQNWLQSIPEEFCTSDNMLRGYKRNQQLVDFDYIPTSISDAVMEQYNTIVFGNKQKMLDYFISKRLTHLLKVLDEF